jgi:anti-sigma B factor antagonist
LIFILSGYPMAQETSEPSDLSVEHKGGVAVVAVRADNLLELEEVSRISAQIRQLLADGELKLILDLVQVQYAGSAALGMLLSIDQDLKAKGGKLVLVNIGRIEALLKISRTRGVFNVAPDVSAAQRMM